MGRITVFALQDCPHCIRSKAFLTERSIPYTEISLTTHPEKRSDMLSLADRLTVPQFFFNETHVGGADDLIATVKQWENEWQYPTPLEYYELEIKSKPDPTDERLQVPTTPPVVESPPPPRDNEFSVRLPDGRKTTVLKMTFRLREILPIADLKHNLGTYKNSFTGAQATEIFMKEYDISKQEAIQFGKSLLSMRIITHVFEDHDFEPIHLYYRLTADHTPEILNSFCVWNDRVESNSMALLKRLKKMLGKAESAVTNSDGLVNYKEAHKNENYVQFEEAVCELQGVDMEKMDRNTRLAFGINLYNLMIKYAFMKLGIGSSALARSAFFSGVKFNIGGDILSFNDLEHGILRGNKRPVLGLNLQINPKDSRARLAIENPDCRIHFGLNCGAKSCPPVKNFTADAIDEELRIVSMAFCEQDENVRIDESSNTLHLTKLLSWFREDFAASNKELPQKVVTFLRGEKQAALQRMIDSKNSIKIVFNNYDWGTNASDFVAFEKDSLTMNAGLIIHRPR